MNFLNPGDQLTAAHWNDLFAEADAHLTTMLGGLSAVFAQVGIGGYYATPDYVDKQWGRGFFFGFDPQNPPNTLHPVALKFVRGYLGQVKAWQNALFWRQYDHAAITGQVAGRAQLSNTSKWNVVKLALPTWAAWSAAVYPSGFTGTPNTTQGLNQTISSVLYPAFNCLDVSLQVHKSAVGGTPYHVTFDTVLNAEHAQPLKGIDVFLLGNVTWDTTNWNKYSIVRAHNCGKTAATIFGTSINPGACRCFRNLAGTWTAQGNYFHWMAEGDGRFLQAREGKFSAFVDVDGGAPSLFQPGIVADVLGRVFKGDGSNRLSSVSNFGREFDAARFFDLTPVYNNPAYVKTSPGENNPPANGYFPVPGNSVPLGDLIIHRGKILVANRAVPNVIHATMTKTVVMTLAVPAPTYDFTDGSNTVANVSNAAVYNETTSEVVPMLSDPNDPATVNWQVNYGTQQIAIVPRGSVYDPGTETMVPVVPAPYAPFISDGDVLRITFDYIPPDDHVWVEFDSFATLAARLTSVGLASRALTETNPFGGSLSNLEIYSASSWHLLDLSCPLVTFLTGGPSPLPAKVVGATQASSPPSLKLPWLVFAATTAVDDPATTALSYKNWAIDANGNPVLGSTVNVTVNNAGSTLSSASNALLPTALVSDWQTWVQTTSQAGGILTIGNFQILSTPFGHALTWEELWPLDAKFTEVHAYSTLVYGGNVRTLRVIYEEHVGLHVTRAAYLNETRYMNYDSWSNCDEPSPWEHGIFPPIGNRQDHPPTARRFMFWHYARVDRQFVNTRWYEHLAADSPWMPNTGWTSQKFPTGYQDYTLDELSLNEFNHVVSFYEAAPLGVDTVGTAVPRAKTGISRMGAFSRTADIWSPFSYWLAGVSALSYPNGASSASISTTSGWYAANTSSVMSNATISQPIPNAPVCQMEHFNAIASLVNGLPPMKWLAENVAASGTTFTLNFAAANILIVNGGSGFTVNQALNFNLKVASVDGMGAILTVAQNGAVVENSYDVYSTPGRPFALGGNATCDTSVGDGSALNFIPTYAPIGVPIGGAGGHYGNVFWPKAAYFSWNGATAGGADPVKDYLTALGLTVETTLPDNYGVPIQNQNGVGYLTGLDANWAAQVATYRWLAIDDVRTLYAAMSLPFVLEQTLAPTYYGRAAGFVSDVAGAWAAPYDTDFNLRSVLISAVPENSDPLFSGTCPVDRPQAYRAILFLREGLTDLCAAVIPENFSYRDSTFIANNPATYAALGNQVVPIIADNSLEALPAEVSIIPGTPPGARVDGDYEHLITTSLLNARLVTIPIDGQINNNPNPPPPGGGI